MHCPLGVRAGRPDSPRGERALQSCDPRTSPGSRSSTQGAARSPGRDLRADRSKGPVGRPHPQPPPGPRAGRADRIDQRPEPARPGRRGPRCRLGGGRGGLRRSPCGSELGGDRSPAAAARRPSRPTRRHRGRDVRAAGELAPAAFAAALTGTFPHPQHRFQGGFPTACPEGCAQHGAQMLGSGSKSDRICCVSVLTSTPDWCRLRDVNSRPWGITWRACSGASSIPGGRIKRSGGRM